MATATTDRTNTRDVNFEYTVTSTDVDSNGISIAANSITLNGGGIDAIGDGTTDADLDHDAEADDAEHKVDGRSTEVLTAPTIRSISIGRTPKAGDTYHAGEQIVVWVRFDKEVVYTGTQQVALTIGTQTRQATRISSSSTSLGLTYYIQSSDADANGVSISANALSGGTIKSKLDGTTDADLSHDAIGDDSSHKVDGSVVDMPEISEVRMNSSPANNDTYTLDEGIRVRLWFDKLVSITGTPQLALTIGTRTRQASFLTSRTPRHYAYFDYTVQASDSDTDGISFASNSLSLNGGTIKASVDGTTNAKLAHDAVADNSAHKVDGGGSEDISAPTVSIISFSRSPESGDTYGWHEAIRVGVTFDQDIEITDRSQIRLALTIGTQTREAIPSGQSDRTLVFKYIVQSSDSDTNGVSIAANSITLNGGEIKAQADGTTDADLDHDAVADNADHKVDGSVVTSPEISSVGISSSPGSGDTYLRGETIRAGIRFGKPITVTGNPQMSLSIGNHTRQATYVSGSPHTTDMRFDYTITSSDVDTDGVSISANSITLNGGMIKARGDGTTDADLDHTAVAASTSQKVNGQISEVGSAPTISSISFISTPEEGDTYLSGEDIDVAVRFDQDVVYTGNPTLALMIGTETRQAHWSSQGRDTIEFTWYVESDDLDTNGISIPANPITLNGGTIKAKADGTTDADLSYTAIGDNSNHKVDGPRITTPEIGAIRITTSPGTGDTYSLGETIQVRLWFNRFVSVTGNPQFALTIGTRTRQASYSSTDRTSHHLFFDYTVQDSDLDTNGISYAANSLMLNGGTIKLEADGTTDADLSHTALPDAADHKVMGTTIQTPEVNSFLFTSSPKGETAYVLGARIRLRVTFSHPVDVTGSPQFALNIGTSTRQARFSSVSSDGLNLYFLYHVQASDTDSNGASFTANPLTLNGGMIRARSDGTTDADLTMNAVNHDSDQKVDGSITPSVIGIRFYNSPESSDTYSAGETISAQVEFSGSLMRTGSPQLSLTIGTQTRKAEITHSGYNTLRFGYIVQSSDRDTDGVSIPANAINLNGGTIKALDGTTDVDLRHAAVFGSRFRKVNGGG